MSIVMMSGLELVGDDSGEYLEAIQLAVDYISGSAGGPTDQVNYHFKCIAAL